MTCIATVIMWDTNTSIDIQTNFILYYYMIYIIIVIILIFKLKLHNLILKLEIKRTDYNNINNESGTIIKLIIKRRKCQINLKFF